MTASNKISIFVKIINFLSQKRKFWTKIEILDKNRNFGLKKQCWTKIKILGKNRNFGLKRQFSIKIEIVD